MRGYCLLSRLSTWCILSLNKEFYPKTNWGISNKIAESSMKLLFLLKRKKEILMMSLITWVTLVVSQVLHYQNEISLFYLTDDPRLVTLSQTSHLSVFLTSSIIKTHARCFN